MPTIDTSDLISVTEAGRLGISKLVSEAECGGRRILVRNNRPVAAVIGIDDLARAEEQEERLLDIALALTRLLTTNDRRHSLDDVLDHVGLTRENLEEEEE